MTGGKLGSGRAVFQKRHKSRKSRAEDRSFTRRNGIESRVPAGVGGTGTVGSAALFGKDRAGLRGPEKELQNTGQADETEVLAAEISARRRQLAAHMQENALREEWRALTALMGKPEMPLATVSGDLERGWPELNEEQIAGKNCARKPGDTNRGDSRGTSGGRNTTSQTRGDSRPADSRGIGIQP